MLYTQNAIFVAFPLVYPSVCLSPDASIMSKRMDISSQLFDTVLTFDLLTLKVASESRVMWATSVPISVFLGLSVLELYPMYATDRRHTPTYSPLSPSITFTVPFHAQNSPFP